MHFTGRRPEKKDVQLWDAEHEDPGTALDAAVFDTFERNVHKARTILGTSSQFKFPVNSAIGPDIP